MIRASKALSLLFFSLFMRSVECSVIMEATAIMKMSWTTTSQQNISTEDIYKFEQDMSAFLMNSLSSEQSTSLGIDNYPFKLTVDVRDQATSEADSRHTVKALVACLYLSEGMHVDLDTVLMRSADPTDIPYDSVELSFQPYIDSYILTSTNTGPTKADLGLIVATCFLTIMLVIVSSVLLYVTGGWDVCQQKCNNCCFEEIDDDYAIDNKSTFQVDDAYDENENGSIETGMVTTTATGMLGAQLAMDQRSAGLVVSTPSRNMMDEEKAIPVSAGQPLGIMSMRKMHPEPSDEKDGVAATIMSRMMPYSNK